VTNCLRSDDAVDFVTSAVAIGMTWPTMSVTTNGVACSTVAAARMRARAVMWVGPPAGLGSEL
jgi:hypothetical protein